MVTALEWNVNAFSITQVTNHTRFVNNAWAQYETGKQVRETSVKRTLILD